MKLVKLQSYAPKLGEQLPCELFIRTSEAKAILLFSKGSIFSSEDLERLKKYVVANRTFVKEEDYLSLFTEDVKGLKESLNQTGKIDSQLGSKISKSFFNSEQILSGENKLDSMVNMANGFIKELLGASRDKRAQTIMDVLNSIESGNSIYVTHANQVAAMSTMIALMVENVMLDNIVEINLVSILHGMGLMVMSGDQNVEFFSKYADINSFESIGKTDESSLKKVIEKHFDGHKKLTSSDNIIYLKHLSLIELNIDKVKIKNIKTPGLTRTIADFKNIQSLQNGNAQASNPYITSKILIIGDRLVSLMNFYKKNPNFVESAVRDLMELNNTEKPILDQKIMEKVLLLVTDK